jgi:hypothetical protein
MRSCRSFWPGIRRPDRPRTVVRSGSARPRSPFQKESATGAAFALGGAVFDEGPAQAQEAPPPLAGHFHPKGKAPSEHTIRVIEAAKTTLPFADTRDFEEQARGLIARRADPRSWPMLATWPSTSRTTTS